MSFCQEVLTVSKAGTATLAELITKHSVIKTINGAGELLTTATALEVSSSSGVMEEK